MREEFYEHFNITASKLKNIMIVINKKVVAKSCDMEQI